MRLVFCGRIANECSCAAVSASVHALVLFRCFPLVTGRRGRVAPPPETPTATLGARAVSVKWPPHRGGADDCRDPSQ